MIGKAKLAAQATQISELEATIASQAASLQQAQDQEAALVAALRGEIADLRAERDGLEAERVRLGQQILHWEQETGSARAAMRQANKDLLATRAELTSVLSAAANVPPAPAEQA